jgi:two-component system nitrogen regulation sensor histidine kinase NtrY
MSRNVDAVSRSYQEYRQLKTYRQPMKNSYTLSFLLITLVVIFSATWFGFYLAKGITGPIQRLGEGMREVARPGTIARSPKETRRSRNCSLLQSNDRLTANRGTRSGGATSNILANITMASFRSCRSCVATINPAAEMMLSLAWKASRRAPCVRSSELHLQRAIRQIMAVSRDSGRQFNLARGSRELAMADSDDVDDRDGVGRASSCFFEDVSHLRRVERMEAWREVARRIAHEIKNPLTPIQLSAQRLRKGYGDGTQERDRTLLEECTRTIIGQVDALKRLVNEFSTFARLPSATFAPEDLNRIVEEALILFRDAHPTIAFMTQLDPSVPALALDRDAIKRAVVNCLDNAVAACQSLRGEPARIEVVTAYDAAVGVVRLEVADNGSGMSQK